MQSKSFSLINSFTIPDQMKPSTSVAPLPSASKLLSGISSVGDVFHNPYKLAENEKIASLEKHVKMVRFLVYAPFRVTAAHIEKKTHLFERAFLSPLIEALFNCPSQSTFVANILRLPQMSTHT